MTSSHTPRELAPSPLLRISAAAAPGFLLLYGILRLVDGIDGDHGPGLAWNLGHVMFFVAFVVLGILIAGIRRLAPATAPWQRIITNTATVAGLAGVVGFLWVILGDLFGRLNDYAPLPDPLYDAVPLLFQLGLMTLLIQLATTRPRQLPAWSPLLVLLGFVPIAVNLDLLPIGAVLILWGLAPLNRRPAAARQANGEQAGAVRPTTRV
jgi:hypothetical protein